MENARKPRLSTALCQEFWNLGIVVSWPTAVTNWALEGTDALAGGTWTPVTNAPVTLEGQSAVVLEPGETRKMFRMKLAL